MLNRRSLRGSGDVTVEKIASTSASVMLRQSPRSRVVSDIEAHWTSRVTEWTSIRMPCSRSVDREGGSDREGGGDR
jgi:hypothetical protein